MKKLKNSSAPKSNPNRKVRLSQCMIVKNEEKNIQQALTWAKDIAFEQIVVDTGSTDRTVEIAKQMGAKIFHYEWNDDFASAKNFALEQATGNWIAFLDADEYFSQEDAKKILLLLQKVTCESNFPTIRVHAIRTPLVNMGDNGSILSIVQQDRIFVNNPKIRYQNRIHEQLALDGECNYATLSASQLSIFHTGYAPQVQKSTNKLSRNIHMLQKEVLDNPNNPEMLSYLGESLYYNNQLDESEKILFKAINISDSVGKRKISNLRLVVSLRTLMFIMVKRKSTLEQIMQIYNTAISEMPEHPDFDFQLGQWFFEEKNWGQASKHYLTSLDIFDKNKTYDADMSSLFFLIYAKLAICYQMLNDIPQSIKYATLSLHANKYQDKILSPLIGIFNSNGFTSSAQEISTFLSKIYDYNSTKDKLFIMKCAKIVSNNELFELIFSTLTSEEQIWLQS